MDALKGAGILLMVMGHVGFGDAFSKCIHGFHMPLFFFASGFFYKKDNRTFFENIVHNLKTLILPYTVFTVICQLLHFLYTKEWDVHYFLLSFFSSNHNRIDVAGAYWFLLCLFSAKTIFDIIMKWLSDWKRIIAIVAITIIGNLRFVKLPLCLDSAMSVMIFMYCGTVVRKYQEEFLKNKKIAVNLLLAFCGLCFGVFLIYICPEVNIRTNSLGLYPISWINAMLCVISLMVMIKMLYIQGNKVVAAFLNAFSFIGNKSLIFLLLNEIGIYCINTAFKMLTIQTNTFYMRIIETIVVIGIISFVAKIVYSTKLRILIGQ